MPGLVKATLSSMNTSAVVSRTISRGVKLFPGRLVRAFHKTAYQFLEGQTHVMVADSIRVQVNLTNTLHHLIQQIGIPQLTDEFGEVGILKDLASVFGDGLHVGNEFGLYARLTEFGQVHLRGIEEVQASLTPFEVSARRQLTFVVDNHAAENAPTHNAIPSIRE